MAQFPFKITTSNLEKQIEAVLNSQSVRKAFIAAVKPIIAESINSAVEETRINFQPHRQPNGEELVGKLGVGQGGIPDWDKLNNAYKLLTVGTNKAGPAQLKISASKDNFAALTYEIDTNAFYSARLTNYISFSSTAPENKQIPWMKYFLNGMPSNPDYTYIDSSDPEFTEKNSRTGIGKMAKKIIIPKESFSLPGYGESMAFNNVTKAIQKNLTSGTIKGKINKALARAINNA